MQTVKWIIIVVMVVLGLPVFVGLVLPLVIAYSNTPLPVMMQAQAQTDSVKTSISLKPNALELWAGALQATYDPFHNASNNRQQLSVKEFPEGVVCHISSPILSWFSSKNKNLALMCSNDGFKTSISVTLSSKVTSGLMDDEIYFSFRPFTIYGIGEWPEISRTPQIETTGNLESVEILQLRANALQIWAEELQNQFNSKGSIIGSEKIISKRSIPTGVICDINLLRSAIWLLRPEKWRLSCSYDEFRSSVDLLINRTAVLGLTDGYANFETPSTVLGTGEWPESAYTRRLLQSNQSIPESYVTNQNHKDVSSRPSEAEANGEPVLLALPQLRPNALEFWAAELLNQFNPTGNITTNSKIMTRRDIPSEVICSAGEVKSGNTDKESEIWELNCSDEELNRVKLLVNGIAARGLTSDSYYDIEVPFIVSGTGLWPEFAYDYQQNDPVQPSPEPGPNNVYTQTTANPIASGLTIVNPPNSVTATISNDAHIVTSPAVNQRPLWMDRLGAIAVMFGILVIVGFIVLALLRIFRHQSGPSIPSWNPTFRDKAEEEIETNFPSSGYQKEQPTQQFNPPPVRRREDIIAEKLFEYQMDEPDYPDYKESFQLIEDPSQKNIGEFGMCVSNRNKEIYPTNEYVFALEVWLFDKVDELKTDEKTKILLSEYLYRSFKKWRDNQLTPHRGTQFTLESQNLLLDCTIGNVNYLEQGAKSIFHDITVNMVVYRKNKGSSVLERINRFRNENP